MKRSAIKRTTRPEVTPGTQFIAWRCWRCNALLWFKERLDPKTDALIVERNYYYHDGRYACKGKCLEKVV